MTTTSDSTSYPASVQASVPANLVARTLIGTGIFSAQLWINRSPWRPAALWAGVAGLLAAAPFPSAFGPGQDWRTLLLALLLVDVLWGSIWRLAGGRQVLLALPARMGEGGSGLPYLQAGSPAAQLLGRDAAGIGPLLLRMGLPSLLLTLVVALVLGRAALVLTVIYVAVAVLAWSMRRTTGGIPAFLFSVAALGLPWLLLLNLATPDATAGRWTPQLALIVLWVVHGWGATRLALADFDRLGLGLLAVAELGLCLFLIVVQAPLWLAPVALLFLPSWLLIARRQSPNRLRILWLLALLLSAAALGQAL